MGNDMKMRTINVEGEPDKDGTAKLLGEVTVLVSRELDVVMVTSLSFLEHSIFNPPEADIRKRAFLTVEHTVRHWRVLELVVPLTPATIWFDTDLVSLGYMPSPFEDFYATGMGAPGCFRKVLM